LFLPGTKRDDSHVDLPNQTVALKFLAAAQYGDLALLVLGRMLFRHRLAADLVAALTFNAFAFGALWVGTFEQRLLLTFLFPR